jgi:hypothetical protein
MAESSIGPNPDSAMFTSERSSLPAPASIDLARIGISRWSGGLDQIEPARAVVAVRGQRHGEGDEQQSGDCSRRSKYEARAFHATSRDRHGATKVENVECSDTSARDRCCQETDRNLCAA